MDMLAIVVWTALAFAAGAWVGLPGRGCRPRFRSAGMPKEPKLGDYVQAYAELAQIRAVVLDNTAFEETP